MGKYEDELRAIVTAEPWAIPELANMRAALDSLVRALPIVMQPDGWEGEAADRAKEVSDRVVAKFTRIAAVLDRADDTIRAANRASDQAAARLEELPSAKVDPFWVNAATVASIVTFRGLELPAKGAIQFIESAMAQDREEQARQALDGLQMEEHRQGLVDARKRLSAWGPGNPPGEEQIDTDDTDAPVAPVSPRKHWNTGPGTGGGRDGLGGGLNGHYIADESGSGSGTRTDGPDIGSVDRSPSVDGGGGGSFPGPGSNDAGTRQPGGSTGGLLPGVVGGGAGAAALVVGSRLATSGLAGAGGGGFGAGAGAGAATGARGNIGAGAGSHPNGGGMLGRAGSTASAPVVSGSGPGSAAAGGRGGQGMMGGGMGGGAAAEKEKRTGLGGLIAPKLEEERDAVPRSAGARAGGRTEPTESAGD